MAATCPKDHVFGDGFLDDFRNCLYVALRKLVSMKPSRLQYDIADWTARGPDLRMSQALRGAGKSTITDIYIPWRLRREFEYTDGHPDFRSMIISANLDLATNGCSFIQSLLYQIPQFQCLIPKDKRRWSMTAFDVEGAVPHPVPSVFSRGIFGRITGDRANLILADDIEVPQNAETQGQREKLRLRAAELVDILVPEGGEIAVLGTPQVQDTLYGYLEKWGYEIRLWPGEYPTATLQERYKGRLAPALQADLDADPALAGQPTEPTRFGPEELEKRKQSGMSRYSLQYLLDTTLSDLDKYPLRTRDLIVCDLDPHVGPERPVWSSGPQQRRTDLLSVGMHGDHFYGPIEILNSVHAPYDYKLIAVDPSGKGKDETGYSVLGTIGGYIYLLECGGLIGGYDDATLDRLVDLAVHYRVPSFVCEQNFGGGMFKALLERKVAERRAAVQQKAHNSIPDGSEWIGAGVEEIWFGTQKEARIIDTLEPVLNQHRLVVNSQAILGDRPRDGQHGETYRLFHQLTRICRTRGALLHDDRLDSLSLGVSQLVGRMHLQQDQLAADRQKEKEDAMWRAYWDNQIFGKPAPRKAGWADSVATKGRSRIVLPGRGGA